MANGSPNASHDSSKAPKAAPKVALAFSGGLDTSYCAIFLREQGYDVHTVTVQTGGFSADELGQIAARAESLGVAEHVTIDATEEFLDRHVRYLIMANALRGDVYPLAVSAERTVQVSRVALYAKEISAAAIAHGSTGAGNDQVRFDVAFRVLAPDLPVLTPIRDQALSRQATTDYLLARGVDVPAKTTRYSINRGLWGTTIGGGPTHAWDRELPDDAYVMTAPQSQRPAAPESLTISFSRGVPAAIDGRRLPMP
jgi:argininosuccinate synthase